MSNLVITVRGLVTYASSLFRKTGWSVDTESRPIQNAGRWAATKWDTDTPTANHTHSRALKKAGW